MPNPVEVGVVIYKRDENPRRTPAEALVTNVNYFNS